MKKITSEIIKYSKMLNSKKLSALRSGNISVKFKNGFYITPSGKKYSSLKNKDIVFVTLEGVFDKKKGIPSSEWKFHQDIYRNKKDAKAIVHAHSTNATAISTHKKDIPAFHYMAKILYIIYDRFHNVIYLNKSLSSVEDALQIPFSVISFVTYFAGVTSKAKFKDLLFFG